MEWVLLAIGLAAGAVIGWLVARLRFGEQLAQERAERRSEQEKLRWVEETSTAMRDAFSALAGDALAKNSEQFIERARDQLAQLSTKLHGDLGTHSERVKGLVEPLEKALTTLDAEVREIEKRRVGAYQGLEEHLRQLGDAQSGLRDTTLRLESAMRSSTERGRWGELQLRRVVELAGMLNHVDFEEQETTDAGRPDMVVRLPNGGELPVDAKAPATAYLEAVQLEGDARKGRLVDHAKAMRQRIVHLSRKQYWAQFERAPDLVVMFVPFESALSAAFEADPELLEYGVQQRVLVASPVTLLALLRSVAFGWQERQVAEKAQEIARLGAELHARIVNVLEPIAAVGRQLDRAVDQFNRGIGSIESRLLPAARRFGELSAQSEELPELPPIERRARQLTLSEELETTPSADAD
ncbi:MAG: DNA recombination protein RmuC [Candidatus Bipolaricaulota bacterium]|nr:MAG: DNA recombination protein RmuC [Candidatus Bipolaricaulota bacterium]